ncbi:hypothetical protein HMPREF0373_01307 [Eubacterium ramulus ATCC 29099]|uniref:Uncharacterized protein n=1 Tax=Eubacterium ramulus ATCC 29099 TaxID=1256908 RepID=U2R9V8_EUBRA|nr:hypothetical protein HMPREF0373_01307 [Eubacterium ramulus ATCC 29099]
MDPCMRSYLQKLVMPVYCVIGKIPAVRNISNKIIVLEKRGRY